LAQIFEDYTYALIRRWKERDVEMSIKNYLFASILPPNGLSFIIASRNPSIDGVKRRRKRKVWKGNLFALVRRREENLLKLKSEKVLKRFYY
jgi:hypothetical protein